MKNLLLIYCCLLFWIGEVAFSQNKYYETRLDAPIGNDVYCVMTESDSTFSVVGRYFIDYGTFNTSWSYFAKSSQFGLETPIIYYEIDTIGGDLGVYDVVRTEYGYVATGYISTNEADESYHIFLLYLDSEGNLIEMKNITPYNDASLGYSIAQNAEGDLFIGGYYTPPFISPNREKLYLTKLNSNGEKLWEYTDWTYPYHCVFRAVLPTTDGGCYAAGYINAYLFNESGEFYLTKFNGNGTMAWERIYDVGSTDACYGMALTQDSGLILCGESGFRKAHLLKTNLAGNSIWSKKYFLNEDRSEFVKVASMPDSTYVAIGSIKSYGDPDMDLLIVKVDSTGNLMWHRRYGQVGIGDYGYSFTPTIDPLGGFVIVGRTDTIVPTSDPGIQWSLGRGYVVKTNCMGLLTLPQAAFTISQDPDFPSRFLFTNQSQYAYPDSIDGGHYILNWGDGSPPFICGQGYTPCTQDTLIHTYQAEGVYGVTLQAIVCNDTSTLTQSICLGISPNPQATFSYEDTGGTILFTNLSQNAYTAQGGYFTWDFGDGSPPVSTEHPNHTYEENGSYTVTLTLIVCQDTSVITQTIDVQTVSLPTDPLKGENNLSVYPNPAQNTLTFQWTSKSPSGDLGVTDGWEISIFAPTGQQILQSTIQAGQTSHSLSVAHLPVGVYFYVVEDGGATLARGKVAVVR